MGWSGPFSLIACLGLSLPPPNPGPQPRHGRSIMDLISGNPPRLRDLRASRPVLTALDDPFIDRFWNVCCSRNLAQQIQATDSGEGDEGAGVQDQDHAPGPSRWRRVSRSRRRSSASIHTRGSGIGPRGRGGPIAGCPGAPPPLLGRACRAGRGPRPEPPWPPAWPLPPIRGVPAVPLSTHPPSPSCALYQP